jgi:hypothetical protein
MGAAFGLPIEKTWIRWTVLITSKSTSSILRAWVERVVEGVRGCWAVMK